MKTTYLQFINERDYWGNLGAGVLPYCVKTKRYLIGLRSDYVKEPNTWGLFGGAINFDGDTDDVYDDTIEEGAIREMREETGYQGDITLIDGYIYSDGSFRYHNYLGEVQEEFEGVTNWENHELKWVTLDELKTIPKKHFGLETFMKMSPELFK